MRIIAGEFRGRKLLSPPLSLPTRPMTDRVRESIFNLLRGHYEDQLVLDLFAGTGSIGLEAISRGAAHCLFIENNRKTVKTLEANIDALNVADRCEIFIGDALSPAFQMRIRSRAHLIFLDPPYAIMQDPGQAQRTLDQMGLLAEFLDPDGFFILRSPCPLKDGITLAHPLLLGPETRHYHTMSVHLYQPRTATSTPVPSSGSAGEG